MASTNVNSTAAAASAAAAAPEPEPQIHVGMLPVIDLRGMSQSELYALSRCTASSFDPLRSDDVVIPKIDRRIFKESSGSRRQTYLRLRFATAGSSSQPALRRRAPNLHHGGDVPLPYLDLDSELEKGEKQQVASLFKKLVGIDSDDSDELVPIPVEYSASEPDIAEKIGSTILVEHLSGRLDSSEELVSVPVEYSASEPDIAERISSTVPIAVEPAPFGMPAAEEKLFGV